MRNRARLMTAVAAVAVAGPLLTGVTTPASAADQTGCPATTGRRIVNTPATYPRTVALTFDDGPNSTTTPRALAVLAKHHVHATFFVIGRRAQASPDLLQQIVDAGHVIGNHTWSHPTGGDGMYGLTPAQLATEIDQATALISTATRRPVCFFRAPQGKDASATIHAVAKARGLTVTNFYTASDYRQPSHLDPGWVNLIETRLEGRGAHPILLLHDGGGFRGNSLMALDSIITWYASRGYVFTDPSGRPFPADLPPGGTPPATGWAVPPGWRPPVPSASSRPQPVDPPLVAPSTDVTGPTLRPSDGAPTTAAGPLTAATAADGGADPQAAQALLKAVIQYLMVFTGPPS